METFTGLGFMLGPPLGGVLYSVSDELIQYRCIHEIQYLTAVSSPYLLAAISLFILIQVGGFKLPFIVMGGLLLSILPVVLVILPKDESKYSFDELSFVQFPLSFAYSLTPSSASSLVTPLCTSISPCTPHTPFFFPSSSFHSLHT